MLSKLSHTGLLQDRVRVISAPGVIMQKRHIIISKTELSTGPVILPLCYHSENLHRTRFLVLGLLVSPLYLYHHNCKPASLQ